MASRIEFVEYIVDQLSDLGNVYYKSMMGEYLIYVNSKYCVGVCDNQMFLKPTKKAKELLREVIEKPMYDGAKPSYLITDIEDRDYLQQIVQATYDELPESKKRKAS